MADIKARDVVRGIHFNESAEATIRRLRRYSQQRDNRNTLQGQTMEEAARMLENVFAFIAKQPNGGAGAESRGIPCVLFPLPNDDEMQALRRFSETTEDDGSYDVPKEMMNRLSMLGAVTRGSRPGWFWLTDFGRVLLSGKPVSSAGAEDAWDGALRQAFDEYVGQMHGVIMPIQDAAFQIRKRAREIAAMSDQNKGKV